jgi:3-methyladenine DNA glycosylase AlkD
MKLSTDNYLAVISEKFSSAKDDENADKMKAYMRNQFEFLGITSPQRNFLQKQIYAQFGKPIKDDALYIVDELWKFQEREYQYFAMDILDRSIKDQPASTVGLIEELLITKSWWDTIDFISASIVGKFFTIHKEIIPPITKRWMDSGNFWLQRSCILFQLKYKHKTDLSLLYSFINRLKSSDEFFIRKAIGWALREYSKTDPEEVLNYVNYQSLKPLSRREALKVIERKQKYASN